MPTEEMLDTLPRYVPAFSSREFLKLIEDLGLTGNWGWNFVSRRQSWSSGFYALLGLPTTEAPDYATFLSLVHPEDRFLLDSAADLPQCSVYPDRTVRIIRPDGTMRFLNCRGRIFHGADGKPLSAAGLVIDLSNQTLIERAQREERRSRWNIFEQARIWTNSETYRGQARCASAEILSLTGITQAEFQDDCMRIIASEDRSRLRATVTEAIRVGKPFGVTKRLILADGGNGYFQFIYVPIRGADSKIERWTTSASPLGAKTSIFHGELQDGLEQHVTARHIRAARSLLDWSQGDLAQYSGFSLSTIRRLEDQDHCSQSCRKIIIDTLRKANIDFIVVNEGSIAITRR